MPSQRDNKNELLLQRAYQSHQAQRYAEAEQLYRRLLGENPHDVDGCNLLGLLYLETDRPAKAVACIKKAIAQAPIDAQAHYNLGIALKNVDELSAATRHFREAARLAPDNAEPLNALGNLLRQLDMPDAAIESYRKALGVNKEHADASLGLSDALNDYGVKCNSASQTDNAIELFEEAVSANNNNAKAWINLGICREQTGDLAGAADAFKSAIAAKPEFVDAHFHLAHLSNRQVTEDEMTAMHELTKSPSPGRESRAQLAYGLACGYEKQGRYDSEFESLRLAHAIKAEHGKFDLGKISKRFDAIVRVFSGRLDMPEKRPREAGNGLVFIVGMPRSGTTLTEQILASHALVHGCGESGIVSKAALQTERLAELPYPLSIEKISARDLQDLALAARHEFEQHSPTHALIVDTTPTNFMHCGLIALLWPGARIIRCDRHPLDVCLSIYQKPLSDDHAYAHDFATLAGYFIEYEKLMRHWDRVLPERCFVLRYDRLINDFENTVRDMLSFCDLPFDENCLRYYETRRVVRTPSAGQVRQPIYTGSLDRWQKYETHLAPLAALLADPIARFKAAPTRRR